MDDGVFMRQSIENFVTFHFSVECWNRQIAWLVSFLQSPVPFFPEALVVGGCKNATRSVEMRVLVWWCDGTEHWGPQPVLQRSFHREISIVLMQRRYWMFYCQAPESYQATADTTTTVTGNPKLRWNIRMDLIKSLKNSCICIIVIQNNDSINALMSTFRMYDVSDTRTNQ